MAVFDDDRNSCKVIETCLRSMNCTSRIFTDAHLGLTELMEHPADIVITDLRMPKLDGLTLLKRIKEKSPLVEVIMVTGYADKGVAIEALRWGAFCLLEKPLNPIELIEIVKRTVVFRTTQQERDRLAEQLSLVTQQEAKRWGIDAFVGESRAMREVVKTIRLLQAAPATSVLITGESGTGKELVARAIHFGSVRTVKPFIPVNCSAIPTELAESTLFGHRKGSFTGASGDRKGCFEHADGGTAFLDEIGDMPPAIQAKLLRVLEDGVVVPVGATEGRKVNVRVIAATNMDLGAKIAAGLFRADLFYRLNAFPVSVPPLRKHSEDVPLLATHFTRLLSSEMGIVCPLLSDDVKATLEQYNFLGNTRELKNIIERALIECAGKVITIKHLHLADCDPRSVSNVPDPSFWPLPANLHEAEGMLIKRAVDQAAGNLSLAARALGISRTKLYRMLSLPDSKP